MRGWKNLVEELVREYRPTLVGYGYLLTSDRAAAEDLVQDAMVKVFSRPRRLPNTAAAAGYVRAAMRTIVIDEARRSNAWAMRAPMLAQRDEQPSHEAAIADSVDLRAKLAVLTPRERMCVVLRHFDDLTAAGVAEELGLSVGAVKRYLSDAHKKLGVTMTAETERVHVQDHDRGRGQR